MAVLTPTKEKGGATKAHPLLYVEAPHAMTDEMLEEALDEFFADSGLNGAFVADVLSGMLTHERCGRHLYRSVEGRTGNPVLQAKYREFGAETERHVEILEQLITQAGGNPMYVSPTARAIEGMDAKLLESTFMLDGSIDLVTAEMAMLDAVFVAESVDHTHWKTFGALIERMPDGALRDACRAAHAEVEAQEDEHLSWAADTKQKLVVMQAAGPVLATLGAKAEELAARVRNWFSE